MPPSRTHLSLLAAFAACAVATAASAQPALIDVRPSPWQIVALADFDGDGNSDILWRHPRTGGTQPPYGDNLIYLLDGATILQSGTINNVPSDAWIVLGAADFDGDGNDDILWRNTDGRVYVYRMDGLTILSAELVSELQSVGPIVAFGDFDGDGDADVLSRAGSSTVHLLTYDPVGGLTVADDSPLVGEPGPEWQVEGAGDFDGDGLVDLFWRRPSDGTPKTTLLGFSGGTVEVASSANLGAVAAVWSVAAVADAYGDGKADVLWRANDGSNWLYWMNGLTVRRSKRYFPRFFEDPAFALAGLADLDGDGDADPVWRDPASGETWASLARLPIRGVELNPTTSAGSATYWIRRLAGPDFDPQVEAEVRLEIQAIRDRTGLTHLHTTVNAGHLLSWPTPLEHEVDDVVALINLADEEGLRVIFNLGTHCQVPNALLQPDNPEAFWFHVGGYTTGQQFPIHVNNVGMCNPPPPKENPCITLHWDMPRCDGDVVAQAKVWFETILGWLEEKVVDRQAIAGVLLAGDPRLPFAAEAVVFAPNFYSEYQQEVNAFWTEVTAHVRSVTELPIGVNLLVSNLTTGNPNYLYLENFRAAIGGAAGLANLDYFDLTSTVGLDLDAVLAPNRLGEDAAQRVILSDFKSRLAEISLEEVITCHRNAVFDYDLEGWWYWLYKDQGHAIGLRQSGPGVPIGPDPPGAPSTWKDAAVDVVRRDVGLLGAPPYPTCTTPVPTLP